MHKGVMPSNNPLPCPSVLSHSFKTQQRMQVDSGIPSESMDAIIFAKLGSSPDRTLGVQVCYSHAIGVAPQTSPLQKALHEPHFMQDFIKRDYTEMPRLCSRMALRVDLPDIYTEMPCRSVCLKCLHLQLKSSNCLQEQ